jgi:hypothetical protein
MGKGTIDKANREEMSLNGKDNKQLWASFSWVGGGLLSHFPFLFAPIGIFVLNNNNYKKIFVDYIPGGELIWVAAVFLIITMGNSIIDFLNFTIKNRLMRIFFLCGGVMFLICIIVYFGIKGQDEPLSPVASVIIWFLSISVSVALYITKVTKEA